MITRAKKPPRLYTFTCDGCSSEFLETEEYFYDRAQAVLRAAGWVNFKPPGQNYQQFCPGCARRHGID